MEDNAKKRKNDAEDNQTDHPESDEEEEEDDDRHQLTKKKVTSNHEVYRQDMSKGFYGYDGDKTTYTDSTDGTVYFWDEERKAWIPKIDDTFMAYYQMGYGFVDNFSESSNSDVKVKAEKKEPLKKHMEKNSSMQQEPKRNTSQTASWFELDEKSNTHVYVSNLPLDITEQEFVDLMQKYGLVMKDVNTGKMKVKLYKEPDGKHLKGDALCNYIKRESVDLALQLLDGSDLRGHKLKVEIAKFTMRGTEYNPALKPKLKRRKDKEKLKKQQERLFDWRPDKLRGERSKHECVVVIKNLFDPKIFDENLGLLLEYRQDVMDECSKCGAVRKVVLHDKHQDGIAQVWFKEPEAADACIQLLNNRWFDKRLLSAETWDGKTKYSIQETREEREARLKKWEQYLSSTNKNGGKDSVEKEKSTNEFIAGSPSTISTHDDDDDNDNNDDDNDNNNDDDEKYKVRRSDQNENIKESSSVMEVNEDTDETRSSAGSDDETDEGGELDDKIKDDLSNASNDNSNNGININDLKKK